jgi:ribosomal protein L7/L12
VSCQYCGSSLNVTLDGDLKHEGEADGRPEDLVFSIRQLLNQGRKIEAIKLYREQMGADLKEAKQAVDAIERDAS